MDRRKILVVDDDIQTAKLVLEILESIGHEVKIASSGEEAISLCISEDFQVIVTDLNMGGMNGIAMAREIVEGLRKRPKVVLVTGSGISKEEAGPYISCVIQKPFVLDFLTAAVEDRG